MQNLCKSTRRINWNVFFDKHFVYESIRHLIHVCHNRITSLLAEEAVNEMMLRMSSETQHRITTALRAISIYSRGLNQNQPCHRTVLRALDLSTAISVKIPSTKSRDILFTTWSTETRTNLNAWNIIPITNYPKILGTPFDNMLKSSARVTAICDTIKGRN